VEISTGREARGKMVGRKGMWVGNAGQPATTRRRQSEGVVHNHHSKGNGDTSASDGNISRRKMQIMPWESKQEVIQVLYIND
jgi:hypothetical protein